MPTSPIIVAVIASLESIGGAQVSAAYYYPEKKHCEILVVAAEICAIDSVQASISFESHVFVLFPTTRKVYYAYPHGPNQPQPTPAVIDFSNADKISLLQLECPGDCQLSDSIELPVLIHALYERTTNVEEVAAAQEEAQISGNKNLDPWSLAATDRSLDTDRLMSKLLEEAKRPKNHHSSLIQDGNGTQGRPGAILASLSFKGGKLAAVPCYAINKSLLSLPQELISHLIVDEDDETMFFGTRSSLSILSPSGQFLAFLPLESQIRTMRISYVQGTKAIVLHLKNGQVILVSTGGNPLITLPVGIASSIIQSSIGGRDVLVLTHPTPNRAETSFSWLAHSTLGYWTSFPLNDLSATSKLLLSPSSASRPSADAEKQSEVQNKFFASLPVASGIESLVVALEGRLAISKNSLDSMKQRLETKRQILRRAISLLSSMSSSSLASDNSDSGSFESFVSENDLSPIVGSYKPDPTSKKFPQPSPSTASYFDIGTFRCIFLEGHYSVQLSITNIHDSASFTIQNLVATSDAATLQVSLVSGYTLSPNQTAIVSAAVHVRGDSIFQPLLKVFFSMEIEVQAAENSKPRTLILPLGTIILDAQNPNQEPFLLCPYTSSLIASSPRASITHALHSLLSSRLTEVSRLSTSEGAVSSFQHKQPVGSAFGTAGFGEGMVVNTFAQGGMVCLEVGYYEPEHLVRFIQSLQREIPAIELQESPLTQSWVNRCTKVVKCLQDEIQTAISLSRYLDGSDDEKAAYLKWKAQFLACQARTDRVVSDML